MLFVSLMMGAAHRISKWLGRAVSLAQRIKNIIMNQLFKVVVSQCNNIKINIVGGIVPIIAR